MLEFEIVVRGLYYPEQLVIDYDPTRRMPVTTEIQAWMDETWQQKLLLAHEQDQRLFDAPLFRFIAATSQVGGSLHLALGDTSYKEYVTTRMPDFAHKHALQNLGNPLAVCSVVETCDNYILLDKRQGVDVYVGRYHVIGGFFERILDMNAQPDPFAAMRREIREETGIQAADIEEQYSLGVVYDLQTPHAEMCFLTRLNVSLHEVLHSRIPEEDEIKHLYSLQVTAESLHEFIVTHHGNISATGEPNLLLYGGEKFGKRWFDEAMKDILEQE
jgi:ADP-ribose pyrophosphatase YjhB (NUDIX family)